MIFSNTAEFAPYMTVSVGQTGRQQQQQQMCLPRLENTRSLLRLRLDDCFTETQTNTGLQSQV